MDTHVETAGEPSDGAVVCPVNSRMGRLFLIGLGHVFVAIGALGIVLPLLPTTVFWIVAVACYSRGAPHLRQRILRHPRFGPPIGNWFEHRVISRRAKMFALAGLAVGFAITAATVALQYSAAIGAVMAAVAVYLASRREEPPPAQRGTI